MIFQILLGLTLVAIGVYTVAGDLAGGDKELRRDRETGTSVLHRYFRWYDRRWESSMGKRGYSLYRRFWGVLIALVGLLVLFGFIDLT